MASSRRGGRKTRWAFITLGAGAVLAPISILYLNHRQTRRRRAASAAG